MRLFLTLMTMAVVAAGFSGRALACSQCMCGTPFPSGALGGVVPMQLRYGIEERYLSKANALEEEPGEEQEREHHVSGFVLWRATDRLALLARMPYNMKEIEETPEGGESETEKSDGFGDAELLALVGLVHSTGARAMTLGLVLGAAAPTGSNDERNEDGERLDSHLQPGSGAWSGTGGLNLGVAVGSGTFDASVLGRSNGESSHGYRFGNALLFNAGFTTRPWKSVQFLAEVNGRTAKRDRFEDGTLGEHTGGTVLYAAPGVRWQSDFGFMIEGGVQIPVSQSLYGDQTEHTTGRLLFAINR